MSRGGVNPGHSTFPSSTLPTPSPSSATIPLSFSGSFEDLGRYAELFSSFAFHQADSSGKLDTSRALYNMETQKSGDDGRRGRSVSRGGSRGPTFRGGNNTGRGGSISSAGSRERHEEHFVDAQSLSSRSHSHSRPPVERHSSQSGLFQSTGSNISHHDPLMLLANTIAQQQALDQTHNQHGSHPVTMPPPAPILPPYNPNFPTTGHTGTSHSLPPITNFPWPYNSSSSLQLDPSLMAGQNHQSAYEFLHSLPSGLGSSGTQVSSSPQTPYHGFPFLPLLGPSVPQNIPLNTQLIYLQLQQQALAQAHQQHQEQLARAQRQPSLLTQQRPVSLNSSAESTSTTPTSTTPSAPAPPPPRNFNPVRLSASAPESSTMSPSDSATPIDTAADIAEEKRRRNTAASGMSIVKIYEKSTFLTVFVL
ncbi:hypothetical protein FRC02_006867 [Tulasnella sp. 418]|nr:hypothetical protein FRC02_006867 [Tulasnella sp. 418]